MQTEYFDKFAAAFVRGKLGKYHTSQPLPEFCTLPLEQLSEPQIEKLLGLGKETGLQFHKFKRTIGLPRVHKVLGILEGLRPVNLLDIGTGRGVFLWPMLNEFPLLPVTCIDILDKSVSDLQALRQGGLNQLTVIKMDTAQMAFKNDSFDVITMLEVLEHVQEPKNAISEICRVARRFVILTAPSKEDNNPEHIHLFNGSLLENMLMINGVKSVKFDYVLNHMIALGKL